MSAKKFSISVDEDILKEVELIASHDERSKNWVINKAIEEFIKNYEWKRRVEK